MSEKSDFAVIRIHSRQYGVSAGSTIVLDRVDENTPVDVLLFQTPEGVEIGTPVLEDFGVKLEIIENALGDKITVSRFRNKSRYRKNKGHRQPESRVRVVEVKKGLKSTVSFALPSDQKKAPQASEPKEEKKVPSVKAPKAEKAVAPKKKVTKKASS